MKNINSYFRKFGILFMILGVGCIADLATKNWAANDLKVNGAIEIIPSYFDLYYVENPAIAFSFLSNISDAIRMPLILTLSLSSTVLLGFLIWNWRDRKLGQILPLVMVLAGAFGNIIDRIFNGYVIDFLYFHWQQSWSFPVFNVADILVTCGVGLLFLQSLLGKNEITIETSSDTTVPGNVAEVDENRKAA